MHKSVSRRSKAVALSTMAFAVFRYGLSAIDAISRWQTVLSLRGYVGIFASPWFGFVSLIVALITIYIWNKRELQVLKAANSHILDMHGAPLRREFNWKIFKKMLLVSMGAVALSILVSFAFFKFGPTVPKLPPSPAQKESHEASIPPKEPIILAKDNPPLTGTKQQKSIIPPTHRAEKPIALIQEASAISKVSLGPIPSPAPTQLKADTNSIEKHPVISAIGAVNTWKEKSRELFVLIKLQNATQYEVAGNIALTFLFNGNTIPPGTATINQMAFVNPNVVEISKTITLSEDAKQAFIDGVGIIGVLLTVEYPDRDGSTCYVFEGTANATSDHLNITKSVWEKTIPPATH
jgi:hypothetical protein